MDHQHIMILNELLINTLNLRFFDSFDDTVIFDVGFLFQGFCFVVFLIHDHFYAQLFAISCERRNAK